MIDEDASFVRRHPVAVILLGLLVVGLLGELYQGSSGGSQSQEAETARREQEQATERADRERRAAEIAGRFAEEVGELDPTQVLYVRTGERGLATAVWVTDQWYSLPCYEQRRVVRTLRALMSSSGGSKYHLIEVVDLTGQKVASSRASGVTEVRGCGS